MTERLVLSLSDRWTEISHSHKRENRISDLPGTLPKIFHQDQCLETLSGLLRHFPWGSQEPLELCSVAQGCFPQIRPSSRQFRLCSLQDSGMLVERVTTSLSHGPCPSIVGQA